MAETNNSTQRYSDEVSLVDLWNVIAKRKWLIIIVAVMTLIVSALYVMTQKRVYATSVQVALARVFIVHNDSAMPLYATQPEILAKQLSGRIYSEDGKKLAWISSAVNTKSNLLDITMEAYTAKDAVSYMKKLTEGLVVDQDQVILKRETQLNNYIKTLSEQLASLGGQQQSLSETGNSTEQLERINTILKLQSEIENARTQASDLYLQRTQVIQTSAGIASLVKPKAKLIYVLGLFLGLMLGVFLAFFAEFVANVKSQNA